MSLTSKCIGIPDKVRLVGIILPKATITSGVRIDYSTQCRDLARVKQQDPNCMSIPGQSKKRRCDP
jgi:hypothetical protein